MRSREEIRTEIDRLETFLKKKRVPQYKQVALYCRIESLKWAMGMKSGYDDEVR
jgi:hypothetical protein